MSMSVTTQVQEPTVAKAAGKYLTFRLQNESYGISVLKIREIIRLQGVTRVPQVPEYIRGVLNLRGKVIPVVDLRTRFGFPETSNKEETCIVVVQVQMPSRAMIPMGLIVDAVEEVANIAAADIEPTPDFGTEIDTTYLLGMAKVKGEVKALLDIDRVIGGSAMIEAELATHRV